MYTDKEAIRCFTRFLKEKGNYNDILKDSAILPAFRDRFFNDDIWVSREMLVAKHHNKKHPSFIYDLSDFHRYTYHRNGGELLEEITAMFNNFIEQEDVKEMFIEDVNKYVDKPTYTVTPTSKFSISEPKNAEQGKLIRSIEEYVERKDHVSPYGLILCAHPWMTSMIRGKYHEIHEKWFNMLRNMAKERQKTIEI